MPKTWPRVNHRRVIIIDANFFLESSAKLEINLKKTNNYQCTFTCVEDKIFTSHDFISLATCTTLILSWILDKSLLKPKRAHIYTKRHQSPWFKIHDDIILSKPMVQAHGTSSHFLFMIWTHESHRENFGSRGLKGQEVCSKKL